MMMIVSRTVKRFLGWLGCHERLRPPTSQCPNVPMSQGPIICSTYCTLTRAWYRFRQAGDLETTRGINKHFQKIFPSCFMFRLVAAAAFFIPLPPSLPLLLLLLLAARSHLVPGLTPCFISKYNSRSLEPNSYIRASVSLLKHSVLQ